MSPELRKAGLPAIAEVGVGGEDLLERLRRKAREVTERMETIRRESCPRCGSPEGELARVCPIRFTSEVPAELAIQAPLCKWAPEHERRHREHEATVDRHARLTSAGFTEPRTLELVSRTLTPPSIPADWPVPQKDRDTYDLAMRCVDRFTRNPERLLLALLGAVGRGKSTGLAWALAGWGGGRGLWMAATAFDRLDTWRPLQERAMSAPVLALDDVGLERPDELVGDWSLGHLLQHRLNKGLPTIITANLPPAELVERYGKERLRSRLEAEGAWIVFEGCDLRVARKDAEKAAGRRR